MNIATEKSMKGKMNGRVGAPRKPIVGLTVKPLRSVLTIARLVALNPGVCELTIRKTVDAHVEGVYKNGSGKVTGKATPRLKLLSKTIAKEGVGRPEFGYSLFSARKAKKAVIKTNVPVAVVTSPAVDVPVTSAPIEGEVVTSVPAPVALAA